MRFIVPAMLTKAGKFVIAAKYTEGKHPNWSRLAEYRSWKQYVQQYAGLAGLELPLRATAENPIYLVTAAQFKSRVHPDVSNVWAGIADALAYVSPEERKFGQKRGSDKYFGGMFLAPAYGSVSQVEVYVLSPYEFGGFCHDLRSIESHGE